MGSLHYTVFFLGRRG